MKNIFVDFKKTGAKIKPLHGVNNGVLNRGCQIDTSEYFKELGVPYARFHDTEYPFGSGNFIDINCIFKDFDADVNDPASYNFALTDCYLKAVKDCGTDLIYRLGVSIENEAGANKMPAVHINPPKDNLKWAQICERIIKHYNEGWADGFHFDIKYWAIWNEPESEAMWTGTREDFYRLYSTAAKHLKENCKNVKIGGMGSIGFYEYTKIDEPGFNEEPYTSLTDYIRGFMLDAKKNGAPVDFFDFHIYTDELDEFWLHPEIAKKTCAECGFPDAEIIIDEWNVGNAQEVATHKVASMTAAAMINMQKAPVDIATYYDAAINLGYYNGLFHYELGKLVKRPCFYTFKMFNELYKLQTSVEIKCQSNIYALAAKNENEGGIMISNYPSGAGSVCVDVCGFEGKGYTDAEIYISDADEGYRLERKDKLTAENFKIYVKLKENSVLYISLKK